MINLYYFLYFSDLSSNITPLNLSFVGELEALEITSTVLSCLSNFSFVLKVRRIIPVSPDLIG